MKEVKLHIWHVMLWEIKKNKNTTERAKKIFSIHGQGVITDHQVWKWFSEFHSGNISLRVKPKPESSLDVDQDALRELMECKYTKLTLDLNTFQSTICHHVKR